MCRHMLQGTKSFKGPNGGPNGPTKPHKIGDFINCSTPFIVYALTCPCNKFYVGGTIRPIRERFSELSL